ncbi:hypothetical protein [Algibacter sp. Ld11]|uniref:hypothetical protein n=1 Tax=Algibacter sp. Ld11 TaxID=649150 RepID=UPI003864EE3B
MKKIGIIMLLFSSLFIASCEENEFAPFTPQDELSDASWILSLSKNADDPYNVNIDTFMSFFDLSIGEVSHEWIIEDGNNYLKEGYKSTDSLPLFINTNVGASITEKKAHVFFRNKGLNTVTLLNKFENPVKLNFSEDYLNSDNIEANLYEENGLYVVDTKFIFDVYGKLKPAFKVLQDGVEILSITEEDMPSIDDMSTWPEIEVEAAAGLTFVDLTTDDRPNSRQWLFADGVPSQTNQEEAFIKFFRLGTYTGSFRSMRVAPLPTDSETKLVPLKIKVIQSSLPFVFDGLLTEDESEKISFRVTGEVDPFSGEEDKFTVHVTNAATGFDQVIPVQNAHVKSDNGTFIELNLSQPIYNSDVITVSYSGGGGIMSTDERALAAFDAKPVVMHIGNNILKSGGWATYAQGGGSLNRAFLTPNGLYWVGANGTVDDPNWSWSNERAFDGDSSLKFSVDGLSKPFQIFSYGLGNIDNIPAGTYAVSYMVYLEPDNNLDMFRTFGDIVPEFAQVWNFPVDSGGDTIKGEWVKVQNIITVPAITTKLKITLNINPADNPNAGSTRQTMFLDDFSLKEVEVRP